jgi:hypothetical protein
MLYSETEFVLYKLITFSMQDLNSGSQMINEINIQHMTALWQLLQALQCRQHPAAKCDDNPTLLF